MRPSGVQRRGDENHPWRECLTAGEAAESLVGIIQDPAPRCRQQPLLMNGLFLFQEAVWLLSHRFYLTLYRGVCRSQPEEMHSGSSRWKYGANCSSCYYHKDVGALSILSTDLNLKLVFFVVVLFCFLLKLQPSLSQVPDWKKNKKTQCDSVCRHSDSMH